MLCVFHSYLDKLRLRIQKTISVHNGLISYELRKLHESHSRDAPQQHFALSGNIKKFFEKNYGDTNVYAYLHVTSFVYKSKYGTSKLMSVLHWPLVVLWICRNFQKYK